VKTSRAVEVRRQGKRKRRGRRVEGQEKKRGRRVEGQKKRRTRGFGRRSKDQKDFRKRNEAGHSLKAERRARLDSTDRQTARKATEQQQVERGTRFRRTGDERFMGYFGHRTGWLAGGAEGRGSMENAVVLFYYCAQQASSTTKLGGREWHWEYLRVVLGPGSPGAR
jgi:hypothetical protein